MPPADAPSPTLDVRVLQLAPGSALPAAEDHPFWRAMDALTEAVLANFARHGLAEDVGARHASPVPENHVAEDVNGHGSVVFTSSDTPDWAHRITITLPQDAARRREIAALIETHLYAARQALPEAAWTALIDGREIAWDAGEGLRLPEG
jgi:hypothetical protein